MTTCEQIAATAAGLAALPRDDVERIAALEHARGCPPCARALGEGVALLGLLELAAPAEALSPAVLSRASADIRRELAARPRSWGALALPAALGLAIAATWFGALGGGHRLAGAPAAATSSLLAALAIVLTIAAVSVRGPLFVVLPLASALAAAGLGGGGESGAPGGFECLAFEVGLSLLPLATAWWLARRARLGRPPLLLAAAAAGGALAGQAVLEITCHAVHSRAHLLVFHTGGVLAALVLGVIVGVGLPASRAHFRGTP